MAMRSRQRNTITIPLRSRPGDYVPGSGPALRGPTLQPRRGNDDDDDVDRGKGSYNATGYIEDRTLLPPTDVAADGRPLPWRLGYVVGWRDLPAAARLFVPAMDVLDYVSPYALEEFEYAREVELDAKRALLEEERQALKKAREEEQRSVALFPDLMTTLTTATTTKGRRKRKRQGKSAGPDVQAGLEAAMATVVVDGGDNGSSADDVGEQRLRGGAIGLCTPKKRKLEEFADVESTDEIPSEQLLVELERSAAEDVAVKAHQSEAGGGLVPLSLAVHGEAIRNEREREEGDKSERFKGIKDRYWKKKKSPATNITIPLLSSRSATSTPTPAIKAEQRAAEAATVPPSHFSLPFPGATVVDSSSETSVTRNTQPRPKPKPPRTVSFSSRPITEYLVPTRSGSSSATTFSTPLVQRPRPHLTTPTTAEAAAIGPKQQQKPRPTPQTPALAEINAPPPPQQPYKLMPWMKSAAKKTTTTTTTKTANTSADEDNSLLKPPFPTNVDDVFVTDTEDDDDAWAVECLEDMELYDVEGCGLVRYFKVRWAGDWPSDQKTTWEPEDNIPDTIVDAFCRSFRRGGHNTAAVAAAAVAAAAAAASRRNDSIDDDGRDKPPKSQSGLFVYPSGESLGLEDWNGSGEHGPQANLNGMYPAHMTG